MKRNYGLLAIISFLLFMSQGALTLGPVYTRSLGANYAAIGALSMISSLVAVVFAIFWGRTTDLLQRRKGFIAVGLATMAVNAFLTSLVPDYQYLYPLRILGAVATAAYHVASLALMGDILAQSAGRGWRMGVYRGCGSLGFSITAFAVRYLLQFTSLRGLYRLAGLLLLAAFAAAMLLREDDPAGDVSKPRSMGRLLHEAATATATSVRDAAIRMRATLRGGTGGDVLADERTTKERAAAPRATLPVMPLLVAALLWSFSFTDLNSLWSNYMTESVGYDEGTVSQLWALAAVLELPMMIGAGYLSDRIGRLPMISLSFVGWALVNLGYSLVPGMPWILGIQLLRSFAYSSYAATVMVYATEVRGKAQRGQVSGLQSSAGGIGAILGSAAAGTIAQVAGFGPMIGAMIAVSLGGAAYLGRAAVRERDQVRRAASPQQG